MLQFSEAGEIRIRDVSHNQPNTKYNRDYKGEILIKNKGNLELYFVKNEDAVLN